MVGKMSVQGAEGCRKGSEMQSTMFWQYSIAFLSWEYLSVGAISLEYY